MSSAESQLIIAFREEMRTGFTEFTTEMRNGFAGFTTEMRDGLSQVSNRLDRTNELLLETRTELHEMKDELHEMKDDMSSKLSGISNFLLLSEKSHAKTDRRFDDLEARMKILEEQKKRQE
jgi:predicted  nucleic acid-binding Zn-ribbon protein